MSRKRKDSKLPAPFLKRLLVDEGNLEGRTGYPFDLPWFSSEFDFSFTKPVTIIVGENGSGKSTLIEAIAALVGYDEAGGGKGYRPVDHSKAFEKNGGELSEVMKAQWLPRITNGWFFRAESIYSVARYLDEMALETPSVPPDYLSWSHGEGFIRIFEERFSRQGLYFLDEPESALSPKRQIELLKLLNKMNETANAQAIVATHSPLLMALPNAQLVEIKGRRLEEVFFEDTSHFKLYREFALDPFGFIEEALAITEEY